MKVKSEKWKWSRSVVSNSLGPHGLQPTRLLCPWDPPGKSTGVDCQYLLLIHPCLFFFLIMSPLVIWLEKAMATHSSTLAWKIPWREEPGLKDFTFTFHFHVLEKEKATHSSDLAWRIPGMGEPRGLPSMGLHRVEHDWSGLAAASAVIRLLHVKKWT